MQLPNEARVRREQRFEEVLGQIRDVIDNITLFVKYAEFDLEVTKRENRHLRNLIERMHT